MKSKFASQSQGVRRYLATYAIETAWIFTGFLVLVLLSYIPGVDPSDIASSLFVGGASLLILGALMTLMVFVALNSTAPGARVNYLIISIIIRTLSMIPVGLIALQLLYDLKAGVGGLTALFGTGLGIVIYISSFVFYIVELAFITNAVREARLS